MNRLQITRKSKRIVKYFVDQHNYPESLAKIITAVSAHETGFWKSNLYKKNYNLFGMKDPVIRRTTSLGEKNGFAHYVSIDSSLKDFIYYLSYFGYKNDYGGDLWKFVWEMKENFYFEEDFNKYYKAVSSVYLQLFSNNG